MRSEWMAAVLAAALLAGCAEDEGASKPAAPDAPPACPACGQPMVKRKSRDGTEFWGCSAYPACKGHRSVK